MRKLIFILSIVLLGACAHDGTPVPNPHSEAVIELMASTPEGVKVYRYYDGGYYVYVAVSKDGSSIAMTQH